MKNLVCLMLILCFLSCSLFAQETLTWKLYVKKIVVEEYKPNKKNWDIKIGKDLAYPDVFFTVSKETQRKWREIFKSPVEKDMLVYDKVFYTQVELAAGDKIKIDVWDKDFGRHDLIGSRTLTIEPEDLVESKEQEIKFGSVSSFVYFFSQYSSLEEKKILTKEMDLNEREVEFNIKEKQWNEEKSQWEKEREEAREKLGYLQQEMELQQKQMQKKEQELEEQRQKFMEEWQEKEKVYLAEIESLKAKIAEPQAPAQPSDEWQEKEKVYLAEIEELKVKMEAWLEKEKACLAEIESLKAKINEPQAPAQPSDEWQEKEKVYLAEIESLKAKINEPQAPAQPSEEWQEKEKVYLAEIESLKAKIAEPQATKEEIKEVQWSTNLPPEKVQKIHERIDKAVGMVRFGLYEGMNSIPPVKKLLKAYQNTIGKLLR